MDPVSVLAFLKNFRNACNSFCIYQSVIMKGDLEVYKQVDLDADRSFDIDQKLFLDALHNKRLSSYVENVNYFWSPMQPMKI